MYFVMTNEDWNGVFQTANAAIGQIGSAVVGSTADKATREYNKEQAEIQRKWAEDQVVKQNAWNFEMWQKTNEYNSPVAQLQRLRDAGLNPLYFGLDGSSANNVQAAQPLAYERANATPFVNPVAIGLESAAQLAQINNIEAQTKKTQTETTSLSAKLPFEINSLRAQVRQSNLNADAQEIINKYLDGQQAAELRVKNSTADVNDATVQKAFAEIEKMDYEKTTMYIGWLETYEKILNLQKQRDLTDKQMDELSSLISKNYAEAKKIGLDVQNYDDITVIGTASHTMKMGPFTVQEGMPITLGMKKAAEAHAAQLAQDRKDKKNKRSPDGQVSAIDYSDYFGPVYD